MPRTRASVAAIKSEPEKPVETEEHVDFEGDNEEEEEIEYEEVEEEVEMEEEEEEEVEEEVEEEEEEEEEEENGSDGAGEGKGSEDVKMKVDVDAEDMEKKHAELLALPPHGSEVYIGGITHDISEAFPTSRALRRANSCLQYKETSPSLAERRGSHPPPMMMLRSNDGSAQISVKLVRTSSFSLPNFEDDTMKFVECDSLNDGDFVDTSKEELMLDAENLIADNQLQNGVQPVDDVSGSFNDHPIGIPIRVAETIDLGLYQWPSMHKLGLSSVVFDSRSVYIIVIPDLSLDENSSSSLYIWIGRDVQWKESSDQVINNDSMCEDNHVHWEKVGRSFIIQNGLATSSLVQIVKEGEEPEQLLKHLPRFSFDKALDVGVK